MVRVEVSGVIIRIRVRVSFMVWVRRGNVREGKCPGEMPDTPSL